MKKKLFSILISVLLLTVSPASVLASEIKSDATVMIPISIGSPVMTSYSVSITPLLVLDWVSGDDYAGTYTVGVKGVIKNDQAITLRPQTPFSMTDGATVKNGTVSQTVQMWTMANTAGCLTLSNADYVNTTGKASITLPGEGTYTGNVGFTFRLDKKG